MGTFFGTPYICHFVYFFIFQYAFGLTISSITYDILLTVVGVPVSGIFYAELVTLDSDTDSDDDEDMTDDAATVIFKPSPYSSPAPGELHNVKQDPKVYRCDKR